jgi:hypothetical protein
VPRRQLLLFAVLTAGSLAAHANDAAQAWKVVVRSLTWEKRWYGTFYGEKCLAPLSGKRARVFIELKDAERVLGCQCKTGEAFQGRAKSFVANIEGTNLVFAGLLSPMADAGIVAAGSENTCAVDEDDVALQIKNLRRRESLLVTVPKIPSDKPAVIAASAELDAFVQRTVSLPVIGSSQSPLTGAIRIGAWKLGDPYIVVGEDNGMRLQLVQIPSSEQAMNGDYCGLRFAVDRYAGRDDESKQQRSSAASVLRRNMLEASRSVPARQR